MPDRLDNLPPEEELRRLLLREEQDRLDRLEARLGDDERLKGSLIPIIADVLRDAGVRDHRRLASSLAPVVVASIKTEISNSRDMMVDALYPITGRLVAAAVRNAFKDLVDQLNEKLDQGLSVDRWRARIKARFTGRSEAEVLLSEGAAFEITDMLLIDRQSGLLITQAVPDAERGEMDSQLLSSILTAIMAFVRDAMRGASEQDLRTLHVGDIRLHLQVSPGVILAVKTKGPPPAGFESALNEMFCGFLAQWGRELHAVDRLDDDRLNALSDDLQERLQALLAAKKSHFRKPSKKGTIALLAFALAGVAWVGWTVYQGWYKDRIESTARAVIAEQKELVGYPLRVDYQNRQDELLVEGLMPNGGSVDRLRGGLIKALPDIDLVMETSALPKNQTDGLASKDDIRALQTTLRDNMVDAIGQESARLSAAIDGLQTQINDLRAELPSAEERDLVSFESWLKRQIVRLDSTNDFDRNGATGRILKEIADRLNNLPARIGLRVVGYADDSGNDQINQRVSFERAALVSQRLTNLGVAPGRLIAVGRSSEKRINQGTGVGNINRRVEFELFFTAHDDHPIDGARRG